MSHLHLHVTLTFLVLIFGLTIMNEAKERKGHKRDDDGKETWVTKETSMLAHWLLDDMEDLSGLPIKRIYPKRVKSFCNDQGTWHYLSAEATLCNKTGQFIHVAIMEYDKDNLKPHVAMVRWDVTKSTQIEAVHTCMELEDETGECRDRVEQD